MTITLLPSKLWITDKTKKHYMLVDFLKGKPSQK